MAEITPAVVDQRTVGSVTGINMVFWQVTALNHGIMIN